MGKKDKVAPVGDLSVSTASSGKERKPKKWRPGAPSHLFCDAFTFCSSTGTRCRSRTAWPGEEGGGGQSRSGEGRRREAASPNAGAASPGANKDRDRSRRKKEAARSGGTPKGDGAGGGGGGAKVKAFRPTANQRGPRKSGAGSGAAAEAAKASLAAAGGPSTKYVMPGEESYEARKARLKKKKKNKQFAKVVHRFWQCVGMAENVTIGNAAAKEAVKALCLTQAQLKHLKKRFEEVDVDGSGTIDAMEFFGMLGAVLESIAGRRPARDIFKHLYLAQIELVFP